MTTRFALFAAASVLGLAALLIAPPAQGDEGDAGAAQARAAFQKAAARGRELFHGAWVPGGKTCLECHGPGPNRLSGRRLKSWPKWDKTAGTILSSQQKLNQMITAQSGGQALPLGSDDLNALEIYVGTLR